MNKALFAIVFVLVYAMMAPGSAQAYLVPLIGAGGVLMTMFIGVFAAVCAALFLVFYNVRRMLRRVLKKDNADAEDTSSPSDH